jgi:FlaA1/EpsC-like NDP-sugar epimerase
MKYTLAKKLLKLRNRHFFIIDAIIFLFTPLLALSLRLDGSVNLDSYKLGLAVVTIIFLTVKLGVFITQGFYTRYWRYASRDEMKQISLLIASAVVLEILSFNLLYYLTNFSVNDLPRSLPLLDGMLSFLFIAGFRFSICELGRSKRRQRKFYRHERVLIVGAGDGGVALVKEIQQSPKLGFHPVAFIDDDPEKLNLRICGLYVVGNHDQIPEFVRSLHIRRVIIAMPSVPGRVIREIKDICQSIGVKTSTLPGINEILNGEVRIGSVRDIQIEDLLRREPIQTDIESVCRFLGGKKVLITGAGGSIGSELCRQVLKSRPAEIILIGHGENSVFNIQQELEQVLSVLTKNPELKEALPHLSCFIADIRLPSRLEYVFEKFRPDIIFHAAAHKHVPMMELNSPEAITNNVQGTKNLVELALRYDVEHFVMISTDKAVNPTSVMGASKRTAEMVVLQAAQRSKKPFVVVRFGNVLGSRGSVVPTFKQQIAKGGPITITHPEVCRYFMTIPEAVQLVLQAAVLGQGGEVFMLNMGQPVTILDLAKDLIRLSGYEVDKDIDIVFTGLRPGEKLYEELFIPGERYEPTQHDKILIAQNASDVVSKNLDGAVAALTEAAAKNDSNLVIYLLNKLVPEYTPNFLSTAVQTEAKQEYVFSEPIESNATKPVIQEQL